MPNQKGGTQPASDYVPSSGPTTTTTSTTTTTTLPVVGAAATGPRAGRRPATTESAYNRLAVRRE